MKKLRLTIVQEFEIDPTNYDVNESPLEVERQSLTDLGPVEYMVTVAGDEDEITATLDVSEE